MFERNGREKAIQENPGLLSACSSVITACSAITCPHVGFVPSVYLLGAGGITLALFIQGNMENGKGRLSGMVKCSGFTAEKSLSGRH